MSKVRSSENPRVVILTRPTQYDLLLGQHGTLGQARFFLERREQSLEALQELHEHQHQALLAVERVIPKDWRRTRISRQELDRFLFEPSDMILAVGQDGLVANSAKYLQGQPVIGINPSPRQYAGVLVPHSPQSAAELLHATAAGNGRIQARIMARAKLDDGQQLLALNEIFIGHASHQSARYKLMWEQQEERQSSSGLIISTGTGATGWARSIHQERQSTVALPAPTESSLAFFVREAWPSISTGTEITEGRLEKGSMLQVISEMDSGGVAFGDGIESDCVQLLWGQKLEIGIAEQRLNLVMGH